MEFERPFTAAMAADCEVSRQTLRTLVARGAVRPLLRGVYVDAAVPDSSELRAAAVLLVTAPGAVICRRTAAWLHGVEPTAVNAHLARLPLEIVVPAGQAASRVRDCAGYSAILRDDELTEIGGLVVTNGVRTLVDCARWLPRVDAVATADALLHRGVTTLDEADEAVHRLGRVPGKRQAIEVVSLAEPLTESPMETHLRLRIVDGRLPRPEAQVEVLDNGIAVYRLDLAYRALRMGMEYDGEEFHSSVADIAADEQRRRWLAAHGWLVLVFRRGDVLGRRNLVAPVVGEALAVRLAA